MIVTAFLLLFLYILFIGIVLKNIYVGRYLFLPLYIVCFLPFYTISQVIVYNAFENDILVNLIRYSKDFLIFSSFFLYILGSKEALLNRKFKFYYLDKLVISFFLLVLLYLLTPIGDVNFLSKLIYAKNIFLIGIVYFFGRNTTYNSVNWNKILKILVGLILFSFIIVISESILETHLHSFLGYSKYNLEINEIISQGNYDLSWSFESQGANPRYASFFADPLEFSASLILFFVISLCYFMHSKFRTTKLFYLILVLIVVISFFLATSRASMFSAVIVLISALYISKNHTTLLLGLSLIFLGFMYLYYFSSEDTRYLVQDTLNFQNTSSLGHLLEWIQGLLSIYENPFGVGLAMSGNANGVDQSIKIGGENQFLIYGVQMGILSVVIYILILFNAIKHSLKVYYSSTVYSNKSLGFIAGLTKIGLLVPLFTANAELYLFVSLFSWYLIGQVETVYNKIMEN